MISLQILYLINTAFFISSKNVDTTFFPLVSINQISRPIYYNPNDIDTDASFVGGEFGLKSYIQKNLDNNANLLIENKSFGTCKIAFNINLDGSISDVKAITMINTKLAEVSINTIKNSPRWLPATSNGAKIPSKKELFISFKISDEIGPISEPK